MSRAACKRTAQKNELRGAVQACAVLGEQAHFQQWQGLQADKYANWYCADPFLRRPLRSLQSIDLQEKNELRNCAPLKREGESRAVRLSPFPVVAVQYAGLLMPSKETREPVTKPPRPAAGIQSRGTTR